MFNLNETITQFNQLYQKNIRVNKSWGLLYLQPKSLDFLNKCTHLIQESVYYSSPFVTKRNALRAALARTQEQSASEALPILKTIVQQLKTDRSILQRLQWEEGLRVLLNQGAFWKQGLEHVATNPWAKRQFMQIHRDWNIHQPFPYHSSEGLLFLLDVLVEYRYHFTQARQELQEKQHAWLSFSRLPDFIAESYRQLLGKQVNYLTLLQNQVLEALLLRLKIAAEQKQVICDDIAYTLIEQIQRLDLPQAITLSNYQRVLNSTTFNQMHRAIEKHGNTQQKRQLYQLAWYEHGEFNRAITTMMISSRRLLIPKELIAFIPKKVKKPTWLFRSNKASLAFLEAQQALLAQLVLPLELTKQQPLLSIRSLGIRYQLLQQSLQQQPALRWWQWQQKRTMKMWHLWLTQQFQKNQANLQDCLTSTYEQVQNGEDLLQQTSYCALQDLLRPLQLLMENGPAEYRCSPLTALLERLSTLLQAKVEAIARETRDASSLMQNFKQDVSTALEGY